MGTYYIASTGYNGAPAKQPHCLDVGCDLITLADGRQHCRRAEHAERNAFYHASANGFQLANGCLYIWGGDPCGDCMRAILAHNLQRVVTVCLDERYVNKDAERIFGGLGIPFLRYTRSQWLARGLNE